MYCFCTWLLVWCMGTPKISVNRQNSEQGFSLLFRSTQICILALHEDIGRLPSHYLRWINILRYWNRLIWFDNNRITKLAFNIDYDRCKSNWCSKVQDILDQLELGHNEQKSEVDLSSVELNIFRLYSDIWRNSV